ncbi:UAA transporter [Auricularia subglabra TFB-10046 SS5]|nr:UAA transporter [Auricularia subglabra TFB-10046 SS5]
MPGTIAHLGLCVGGVYACFLVWAIAQERMSVKFTSKDGSSTAKFTSILTMNTAQSAVAALASFLYLYYTRQPGQSLSSALGLERKSQANGHVNGDAKLATGNAKVANGVNHHSKQPHPDTTSHLLWGYFKCAVLLTAAAPFGFVALSYISYPAMVLGKSCKLVPVMLMHKILYRRRYPMYKYAVVTLLTVGIALFMVYSDAKKKPSHSAQVVTAERELFGLALLVINLALDGTVYSTQDEIIARHGVSGQQMMFWMNLFATLLTTVIALLPLPYVPVLHPSGGTTEFAGARAFFDKYPSALPPLAQFAATGALGQLFIFETLRNFGSLTLVTITLTRKLFTMLLSVVVYRHKLTTGQWIGGGIVFLGITLEAWIKRQETLAKRAAKKKHA